MMKIKNVILLLSLSSVITACQNQKPDQGKAEALIKTYLDSALNDPKSYESISFSKLDSVTMGDVATTKMLDLTDEITEAIESKYRYLEILQTYDALKDTLTDKVYLERAKKVKDLESAHDSITKKVTNKQLSHWKIKHQFRSKNGFGALAIGDYTFEIDSNLTKIISAKNIK